MPLRNGNSGKCRVFYDFCRVTTVLTCLLLVYNPLRLLNGRNGCRCYQCAIITVCLAHISTSSQRSIVLPAYAFPTDDTVQYLPPLFPAARQGDGSLPAIPKRGMELCPGRNFLCLRGTVVTCSVNTRKTQNRVLARLYCSMLLKRPTSLRDSTDGCCPGPANPSNPQISVRPRRGVTP